MQKGNGTKRTRRERRIRKEMLRMKSGRRGHGWAARQASKRINTHRRQGSVAGSVYWRG